MIEEDSSLRLGCRRDARSGNEVLRGVGVDEVFDSGWGKAGAVDGTSPFGDEGSGNGSLDRGGGSGMGSAEGTSIASEWVVLVSMIMPYLIFWCVQTRR